MIPTSLPTLPYPSFSRVSLYSVYGNTLVMLYIISLGRNAHIMSIREHQTSYNQ